MVRAGWLGSNVSRPILASVYHFGFVFLDSQKIQTKWWQAAYGEGIRGAPRIREGWEQMAPATTIIVFKRGLLGRRDSGRTKV